MKMLHLSGFSTFQVNDRSCISLWNLGKGIGKYLKLKPFLTSLYSVTFCCSVAHCAEGQNNNVSSPFLRYHFLPLKDP